MPHDLLAVEGLKAGYGRIPVLFGIDLRLGEGEFIGVLGHNGMGKTTLLRTLMGHMTATAGAIRFDAHDITRWSPHQRARAGIGYVPQGRQIFANLTVLENLRMGAICSDHAEAERRIEAILADFPRLKPILARSGGVLSGGEQQILALARCLCGRPRLLLLDEPTEGIQPSIIDEIAEALLRLSSASGLAVILVEQNLEFIRHLAKRILVIRKGVLSDEISADGLDAAELNEFVELAT